MDDAKILLSICFITYNHERFAGDALNGFASQKVNFPIEIIIYDDFSTDATRDLLKEFKETSPFPVTLLFPCENKYSKGERIFPKTFEVAQGKYLALCEGDDYWTDPLKLQKQVDFMEANDDYNICFHSVLIYNEELKEISADTITRKVLETTDSRDLAKGNYIHTPSVVLRNNFTIPTWFIDVFIGDWSLYMLQIKDKKIKRLDETMAVYRIHSNSLWSSKPMPERINNTIKSMELVLENVETTVGVKEILKNKIVAYKIGLQQKESGFKSLKKKIKNIFKL